MHELRGFQRDLLFVLGGLDDPNGQEILEEMRDSLSGDVQQGRLYANLNELVDIGLVEKSRRDGRENAYGLTEAGHETVEARHEWERRYLQTR